MVSVSRGLVVEVDLHTGRTREVAETGGGPNGLAEDGQGRVWVAQNGGVVVPSRSARRVTPSRNCWITEPSATSSRRGCARRTTSSRGRRAAVVHRPGTARANRATAGSAPSTATGAVSVLLDGIDFPNGLALGTRGDVLHVAEYATGRVVRYDWDGAGLHRSGIWGPSCRQGGPDGLALDRDGRLGTTPRRRTRMPSSSSSRTVAHSSRCGSPTGRSRRTSASPGSTGTSLVIMQEGGVRGHPVMRGLRGCRSALVAPVPPRAADDRGGWYATSRDPPRGLGTSCHGDHATARREAGRRPSRRCSNQAAPRRGRRRPAAPARAPWSPFSAYPPAAPSWARRHPECAGAFLPPIPDRSARMFAGGRLRRHQPMRIGDTVTLPVGPAECGRLKGLQRGDARSSPSATSSTGAKCCSRWRSRTSCTGSRWPAPASLPGTARAEDDRTDAGEWRLGLATDPLLLFRFSALTANAHRIHYDHDYARDVEGYPGLVVHGPLLALLLLELPRRHCAQRPLVGASFRLQAPVFAGQDVLAVGLPGPDGADVHVRSGGAIAARGMVHLGTGEGK